MSINIGSKYTNNNTGEECTISNSRRRGASHKITIIYDNSKQSLSLVKKYFLRNFTEEIK